MRFRQHLCEYAIKYGVTRASRRYHTNRQFVYRQLKKYDGYTRSYGKVERSHREDGKILYGRKIFISEKELKMAVKKHMQRYNSTAKISLNFKSPNEIVSEYLSKCNICLDN